MLHREALVLLRPGEVRAVSAVRRSTDATISTWVSPGSPIGMPISRVTAADLVAGALDTEVRPALQHRGAFGDRGGGPGGGGGTGRGDEPRPPVAGAVSSTVATTAPSTGLTTLISATLSPLFATSESHWASPGKTTSLPANSGLHRPAAGSVLCDSAVAFCPQEVPWRPTCSRSPALSARHRRPRSATPAASAPAPRSSRRPPPASASTATRHPHRRHRQPGRGLPGQLLPALRVEAGDLPRGAAPRTRRAARLVPSRGTRGPHRRGGVDRRHRRLPADLQPAPQHPARDA